MTIQFWTAVSTTEEDLHLILRLEVKIAVAALEIGSLHELKIYQQTFSSWRGDYDRCFDEVLKHDNGRLR